MQSIRSRLMLGYTASLISFVLIPAIGLSFVGRGNGNELMISLGLLTIGALIGLLCAHLALVRLMRALAVFDSVQADNPEGIEPIDPSALPLELRSLAQGYNAMVNRLEIRRQKLHDQLRRTALLTRLSIELRETLDPADVIRDTLTVIAANADADGASIILISPDGSVESATCLVNGECQPIPIEQTQAVLERGLGGWVVRYGRSVVLGDVQRDPRWLQIDGISSPHSVIAIPLTNNKSTLGLLTVTNEERDHFTGSDLLLLEGVAAQAGVALVAAMRHAEERRSREQAILLFSMSQFLVTKRTAADLAHELMEKSGAVFDARATVLYLRNEDNQQLVRFATRAEHGALLDEHGTLIEALAQRAWRTNESLTETLNGPNPGDSFACVALPLSHHGTAIGVFVAVRRAQGPVVFPARTWSMLTIFTNVAAAAFVNLELFDQLQQRAEALEQLVNERTRQLQHSRDMLRIVFDNLPDGLVLLDGDGRILTVNNALCQNVLSRRPPQVVQRTYQELAEELRREDGLELTEMPSTSAARRVRFTTADGEERWYEIDYYSISQASEKRTIERWRDITRQEELHRQLLLHEQMTSMGRLAASVVHEVGNPLQGMRSCLDLAREEEGIPSTAAQYLDLATSELDRIGALLQRWRDLYRLPQSDWQHVDLNQLLQTMRQITQRQMMYAHISLDLTLQADLPLIYGQPDALRQVCLNLLLNAQEAMPDGGMICIRTEADRRRRASCFQIIDNGGGMSSERVMQLFAPFQTNRSEKLGLGLYLSKMIVDQHRGDLQIDSVVGHGTTATVWLPWDEAERYEGNHSDR